MGGLRIKHKKTNSHMVLGGVSCRFPTWTFGLREVGSLCALEFFNLVFGDDEPLSDVTRSGLSTQTNGIRY